jgi:hypothetical protein
MEALLKPLPAQDQLEIADALYRFAAGQDLRDPDLLASAFTDDAELDFSQPAHRLGITLAPFHGRGAIVAQIVGATEGLDTTHTVTNPRAWGDGPHAGLTALVEAQHLPRGDHARHLLLKNIYRARLRRDGGMWRMQHLAIHNVWMRGDPAVLFGPR